MTRDYDLYYPMADEQVLHSGDKSDSRVLLECSRVHTTFYQVIVTVYMTSTSHIFAPARKIILLLNSGYQIQQYKPLTYFVFTIEIQSNLMLQ